MYLRDFNFDKIRQIKQKIRQIRELSLNFRKPHFIDHDNFFIFRKGKTCCADYDEYCHGIYSLETSVSIDSL